MTREDQRRTPTGGHSLQSLLPLRSRDEGTVGNSSIEEGTATESLSKYRDLGV